MPRKVAFSAKAKKKQLQLKREGKRDESDNPDKKKRKNLSLVTRADGQGYGGASSSAKMINQQPGRGRDVNRYNLKFHTETKEEIEKRKESARQAIIPGPEKDLEIGIDSCYHSGLDFPKRQKWSYECSPQELDMKENKYFREYVDNIEKTFTAAELSYFELNLETWRQLWRVLEMSDILIVVVDARFPSLLFPPSLYSYVIEELKRDIILVMNKIDLVPATVVAAWKHYFKAQFPLIKIVCFTSLPSYNLRDGGQSSLKGQRRKGKMKMAAEGALSLLQVCEEICAKQVDLSSWRNKILEEMSDRDFSDDDKPTIDQVLTAPKPDWNYTQQERYQNNILTIGCVGQPNVGKSSLINALMGKKVVSVSRTPGHTKHFQTIFLTSNVRLCDCPGLVFPSKVARPLQILVGSFPIAHLREPYTTVAYLAKYLNLPELLKIKHPSDDDSWSAYDVCEAWAIKRGFMTKRAARPDEARAANHLLRYSLEGRICLYLRPPNYSAQLDLWQNHEDLQEIIHIQALYGQAPQQDDQSDDDEDEDEVEEQDDDSQEEDEDDNEDEGACPQQNKFALLQDD